MTPFSTSVLDNPNLVATGWSHKMHSCMPLIHHTCQHSLKERQLNEGDHEGVAPTIPGPQEDCSLKSCRPQSIGGKDHSLPGILSKSSKALHYSKSLLFPKLGQRHLAPAFKRHGQPE
ncbi:hypothetical protein AOLI_G00171000 [Acnodon oligacanthus]